MSFRIWQEANRGLPRLDLSFTSVNDPGQYPHVLAESRPHELSILVSSEPVYVKDLGQLVGLASETEPMREIIPKVVPAKRFHGHGVASYLSCTAYGRSRHFRCAGCTHQYTMGPVLGFID